jgi:polyphosphate kinase
MILDRDLGWLDFNSRVLHEAQDPGVPVLERLKFLGIFSSNLDEFFRVRVGALRRHIRKETGKKRRGAKQLLCDIEAVVVAHQNNFDDTLKTVLSELEKHQIYLVNESQLTEQDNQTVQDYFKTTVRPELIPILLDQAPETLELEGNVIYMAIEMSKKKRSKTQHAIVEVPTGSISRFLTLPASPSHPGATRIMLLEDIIRHCLKDVFYLLDYTQFSAYTIKLTRDAELDMDDDITESLIEKLERSVHQRKNGEPVRMIYEDTTPKPFLKKLIKLFDIPKTTTLLGVKRRYHNFKDFIKFPRIDIPNIYYPPIHPVDHPDIRQDQSLFDSIQEKDILLQYPYHRFMPFLDFLREAAIDPTVTEIHITLYRAATQSRVVKALINALKNGKEVFVVIELKARFDEEANIHWSKELSEAGAKVIFGLPGLKVHSKLCMVTRKEGRRLKYYANISTGNYNENTATLYSDLSLFTAHPGITHDILHLFHFFENPAKIGLFKHLVVAPFSMRKSMTKYIRQEIQNAKKGLPARIIIKVNALVDTQMNERLMSAIKAGVSVDLLVRGPYGLPLPDAPTSVRAVSILDRFLEHSRVLWFENAGTPKVFISSGDWIYRSFERRIEVACPIYDPRLVKDIQLLLDTQLNDQRKGRNILEYPCLPPHNLNKESSQTHHYKVLKERSHG